MSGKKISIEGRGDEENIDSLRARKKQRKFRNKRSHRSGRREGEREEEVEGGGGI